ncbi:hypothetical protein J2X76_003624 [Neorhizobium sp. 2083]|uniref:hypothetical protein n=1 Tax=Neorhizobium sp. 2083 TaxID=2817762 RepID=UPI002857A739|nr:hypothetical protein [Neorhizobium sp. 2083]MDR6818447.1 hypothetical protein [Neorhizobium sp. 2083]
MRELKLQPENTIVDIPDLNRFQIGDHVVVDATGDFDRFEGVIIGMELRRMYGSSYLKPSITILHDGCITDEFKPSDCRKVDPPSPATNMEPSDELRKRVMRAIFDPGATEGFKGDRDLTTWQTDAVMRVIAEGRADA